MFRLKPQIASSDETKDFAFNGRYRQEGSYVPSLRDVRVRSTVSRRGYDDARMGCRQYQPRASADTPRREEIRRGMLTDRSDGGPAISHTSQQGDSIMAKRKKAAKKKKKR